jgi:hypothetical protein
MRQHADDPIEAVIKAAWLEWTVARTVSTCNGEKFIPYIVDIPRNFRRYDLGLSRGPSIFWTQKNLAKINRRNRTILSGKAKQKQKRSRELEESERRGREWRAILKFRRAPLSAAA